MAFWDTLFKPSDFPEKARVFLENEGLLFVTERKRVTVVYRNFKSPRRRCNYKKEIIWGSLGISQKRVVGYGFRKRIIHLPFDEDKAKNVKFSCFNNKVLVIAFDPSLFSENTSGSMEIRYHFDEALDAYNIINQQLSST